MEPLEFWLLMGILAAGAIAVGIILFIARRRRPIRVEPRNRVIVELEAAAARFGAVPGVDLELPEPEVVIDNRWAQGVNLTAQYVAEQQRLAIERRGDRRAALRALRQIRRGVARVTTMEEQAVEDAHQINDLAQTIGMEPLEIVSETEVDAALGALRRANATAEAMT